MANTAIVSPEARPTETTVMADDSACWRRLQRTSVIKPKRIMRPIRQTRRRERQRLDSVHHRASSRRDRRWRGDRRPRGDDRSLVDRGVADDVVKPHKTAVFYLLFD